MKKIRLTKTRSQLLKLLKSSSIPLPATDLIHKVDVNKTTVYRQLESLISQGLVKPVLLSNREAHYEYADREHHHHLICTNCKKITDIAFSENIEDTAAPIASSSKFQIKFHNLEFFGLCQNCQ